MKKPTTVRLPEDLLEELDRRARDRESDRASLIRELLREGLSRDLENEVLEGYGRGRISMSEAVQRLGIDAWAWFELLRRRGESLNVELEDWIDSRESL
ncbi:MAG: CopG family transcriptional regulator [Thermoanaerobaculia bacterium]|nr:CopG family transcriptional regulator [Thermoanaerobaculia bacterium]